VAAFIYDDHWPNTKLYYRSSISFFVLVRLKSSCHWSVHTFELLPGGMRLSAVAELSPEIIARLEEQGIKTDSDFLSLTGVEILRKLPHGTSTLGQIHDFKTIVARVSSAPGVSARIRLDSTPVSFSGDDASCPASLGLISLALAPYSGRVVEVSGTANSRKSVNST
jgi:hypothetical protein